ncbi:Multicopper oxidase type 2 [Penicillium cf. viridicatum]|uniref:Multicopper oxidase type 2 n=1 Tax=Penicillium cf. viridicatum TaxID=2972119 RepID=A0A9W9M537_9EURO|nr:Multicopper oxidase type 2 [Penicillium cf. viridicatum]
MISNDTEAHFQINNAIRDPKLLMISDWFHNTSEELRDIALSANLDILCADSILINGKGRVRCLDPAYLTTLIPAPLAPLLQGMNYTAEGSKYFCLNNHNYTAIPPSLFDQCNSTEPMEEVIKVDPLKAWVPRGAGYAYSLNIVSINNHSLWVYEVDGRYIVPTQVDALTLNNGARYSVLVQLKKTPGNYLITAASAGINQKVAGYGTFSYVDGDPSVVGNPSIDYGGNNISTDVIVLDENKIKPLIPSRPSEQADQTYLLTVGHIEKVWKWALNGDHSCGLSLESDKPMLWDPQSQADSDLVIATKNDTWVDIVFGVTNSMVWILICVFNGAGTGEFNWTSVAEAQQEIPEMFNLVDPPMRDTFTTLLPCKSQAGWQSAIMLGLIWDTNQTSRLAILDGIDAWLSVPTQYGLNGHWGKAGQTENIIDDRDGYKG